MLFVEKSVVIAAGFRVEESTFVIELMELIAMLLEESKAAESPLTLYKIKFRLEPMTTSSRLMIEDVSVAAATW